MMMSQKLSNMSAIVSFADVDKNDLKQQKESIQVKRKLKEYYYHKRKVTSMDLGLKR